VLEIALGVLAQGVNVAVLVIFSNLRRRQFTPA
jgi:hypothetical protein